MTPLPPQQPDPAAADRLAKEEPTAAGWGLAIGKARRCSSSPGDARRSTRVLIFVTAVSKQTPGRHGEWIC